MSCAHKILYNVFMYLSTVIIYRLFKLVLLVSSILLIAGIYVEYQSSQIKVFHKSHICRQSLVIHIIYTHCSIANHTIAYIHSLTYIGTAAHIDYTYIHLLTLYSYNSLMHSLRLFTHSLTHSHSNSLTHLDSAHTFTHSLTHTNQHQHTNWHAGVQYIDLVACITSLACHCSSFVVFTVNDNFF